MTTDQTAQLRAKPAVQRAIFLAGLLGLLLVSAVGARAQSLPDLTGRVVDRAGILTDQTEAEITTILADHEAKSSDQLVVATISSTDGQTIERYANDLFRQWQLGQAEENNGVLLLVAVNDRKMRIEVGYGLEGTLTDVLAKLIIDNTIVPKFRSGDFEGGIRDGVRDILAVLSGDEAELRARAERHNSRSNDGPDIFAIGFFALFGTVFGGMILMAILAPIFGTKIGPGRYKWLGMHVTYGGSSGSGGSSGRSSSSGGFSGGGGSSGGGGASGGW